MLWSKGVLAVAWALVGRQAGPFPWGVLLAGLAGVAVGIVTFLYPGLTGLALLYLIAAWAIVRGIFEIIAAVHLRKEIDNEWLLGLSGFLSLALGVILVLAPGAGALAVLLVDRCVRDRLRRADDHAGVRLKGVKDRVAHRIALRPPARRAWRAYILFRVEAWCCRGFWSEIANIG